MQISGKKLLLILGVVSVCLGLAAKMVATHNRTPLPVIGDRPKPGYRPKFFQTFENAKATAEQRINEDPARKNIITRYESSSKGWVFYFESLSYLSSGNPKDRDAGPHAILIYPNNTSELLMPAQ